jgi:hypothetical protein
VKLGIQNARAGQRIYILSGYIATVAAQVCIAKIIGNDQQDISSRSLLRLLTILFPQGGLLGIAGKQEKAKHKRGS